MTFTLKLLIAIFVLLLITKLSFWSVRDYYYQLKYGVFMVDYELFLKDRTLYRSSIKKLTPDEIIETIDSNYFEAVGVMDWLRIPMVYPYTMNFYNDLGLTDNDYIGKGAFLTNAKQVDYRVENPDKQLAGETAYMDDEYGEVLLENIIAFSFNYQYLIAKKGSVLKDDLLDNQTNVSYFVFEFGTDKIQEFSTYKELMKEAKRIGYKRHKCPLNYTKESPNTTSEKNELRKQLHIGEEHELFPFINLHSRYNNMRIEI